MAKSFTCSTILRDKSGNGFTLLEMSIVLAIIAVIIAGGLTVFSASLQKDQREETRAKLAAIQQALYNYRIANGRLPCPADITIAIGNTNFGMEAGSLVGTPPIWTPTYGDCYSTGTVKANFSNVVSSLGRLNSGSATIYNLGSTTGMAKYQSATGIGGIPNGDTILSVDSSTQVTLASPNTGVPGSQMWQGMLTTLDNVEGMVPVKTLQLPDDDAIDGWGRRIMYAVDARFTAGNAFTTIPVVDGRGVTTTCTIIASGKPGISNCFPDPPSIAYAASRMQVNDASGNVKTTAAAYVLVSFGPDGFGAYPRGSGTTNLNSRIDTGSVNTDQKNNCDCKDSGGNITATTFDGIFVQKMPTQDYNTPNHTNDFDDVVAYGTRSDLRSPTE